MSAPDAAALISWYRAEGRDLPWRREPRTTYRVLVAEVMLQQTRADVVAPRYEAFLARFPDFRSLAAAEEGEVMRHFEGMGYYARIRNLHRLARIVAQDGGSLPRERPALLALPGIGPYVASAVLSFAYGEPSPALDANVRRVALRFAGSDEPAGTPAGDRLAGMVVEDWLRTADPRELHDALMDLGALVCTARVPHCVRCPLGAGCVARQEGRSAELGLRPAGRKRRTEAILVARVISPGGQAWRLRPAHGLLGAMWEPPHVLAKGEGVPDMRALEEELHTGWGIEDIRVIGDVGTLRHVFTHIVWVGRVVEIQTERVDIRAPGRWLDQASLSEAAIPSAFRLAVAKEFS